MVQPDCESSPLAVKTLGVLQRLPVVLQLTNNGFLIRKSLESGEHLVKLVCFWVDPTAWSLFKSSEQQV